MAERVAERLDGRLLRTDVVRKELYPDPSYSSEESAAVYDELFERARAALETGAHVVLDGTFRSVALRERAAEVAADCGAAFRPVRVTCVESVVRERIAARADDPSDADFAIHKQIKAEFEPIEGEHLLVDNSGSLEATLETVDEAFPPVARA